jgi:hypothetical protein
MLDRVSPNAPQVANQQEHARYARHASSKPIPEGRNDLVLVVHACRLHDDSRLGKGQFFGVQRRLTFETVSLPSLRVEHRDRSVRFIVAESSAIRYARHDACVLRPAVQRDQPPSQSHNGSNSTRLAPCKLSPLGISPIPAYETVGQRSPLLVFRVRNLEHDLIGPSTIYRELRRRNDRGLQRKREVQWPPHGGLKDPQTIGRQSKRHRKEARVPDSNSGHDTSVEDGGPTRNGVDRYAYAAASAAPSTIDFRPRVLDGADRNTRTLETGLRRWLGSRKAFYGAQRGGRRRLSRLASRFLASMRLVVAFSAALARL